MSWILDVINSITYGVGRVFGGYRLTTLEQIILDEISQVLPNRAARTYRSQLDFFDLIEHSCRGRSTRFFSFHGREFQQLPEEIKFECRNQRLPFIRAFVRYKLETDSSGLRIDLYLSDGCLDELVFEISPQVAFGSSISDLANINASDISLLFDPSEADPFPSAFVEDLSSLPGWLLELTRKCSVREARRPIEESSRQRLIKHYGVAFPSDYVALAEKLEFLDCDSLFVFMGPSRLWSYTTPLGRVIQLAKLDEGAICILPDEKPGLYYIDDSAYSPVPIGNSFRDALERAVLKGVQPWRDQM